MVDYGLTQIWIGDPPNTAILNMHSLWSQYFDQTKCRFISGDEPFDFCRDYLDTHAVASLRRLRARAAQTDLLRLIYLHAFGGLWSDIDHCPLMNPHFWIPDFEPLVYQEERGNPGNNFIGAMPQHPAILLALEMGLKSAGEGFTESILLATGPGLLTRAIGSRLAKTNEAHEARSVRILHRHNIQKLISFHCPLDYKTTSKSWQRTESFEKIR